MIRHQPTVFIANVEIEALEGSEMRELGIGGFVYCFIPADSAGNALRKLKKALKTDRYKLLEIKHFDDYQGYTWDDKEGQKIYDEAAQEATATNAVVYGPFFMYESEEDEESA